MKKQTKVVIILAAVLAVLVAGNIIIKKVTSFNSEKREKESEEESLANIVRLNDFESLSSISFGEFSFRCNDENDWSYDGDADFLLDDSIIKSVASEFAGMTATRKIEDCDTLESYGLDNPEYTVDIEASDGTKQTLYVGSNYNGEYYVKTSDSDVVYTCKLTTTDELSAERIEEFAVIENVNTVWNSTYYSFDIDAGEKSISLKKDRSVDVYSEDETDENGEQVPNVVWNVSLDGAETYDVTDTQDLSDVRNALDFTYDGCLVYNPDEESMSEYGFDDPAYVITIGYTDDDDKDCEMVLTVGAYDEGSETYSVVSNLSDIIYSVSQSKISSISGCFDYDFLASEDNMGSIAED